VLAFKKGVCAVTLEKIAKFILTTAGIAAGLFLFPFLLKIFAPFVFAFIVAIPCQKIVGFLEKKLHINRGISSAIISTLIVTTATAIVIIIGFQLFAQAKNLISALPAAIDSLRGQFNGIITRFDGYKHSLPKEISTGIDRAVSGFKEYSGELSHRATSAAFSAAGSAATRLPGIFLFFTMFILGTFFFTKDYVLVINFFKELFPQKVIDVIAKTKSFISGAFCSYMKAQLILMSLTSAIVSVSLWIVGIDYPLLWGILSGLVDALPFLGTATVLIPMALFAFAFGDKYAFTAILIIQVLVFLVRQLAEPKVVSRQIGIHPILTLVSVYIGLRFFGFVGVILAPIAMVMLVNLYVSYKENSANNHFENVYK